MIDLSESTKGFALPWEAWETPLPLAFSRDGRHLVFGLGKALCIHDVVGNKEIAKIELGGMASTFAWAPDGQSIAVHRQDGAVVLASLKPPGRIKDLGVERNEESLFAGFHSGRQAPGARVGKWSGAEHRSR